MNYLRQGAIALLSISILLVSQNSDAKKQSKSKPKSKSAPFVSKYTKKADWAQTMAMSWIEQTKNIKLGELSASFGGGGFATADWG